MKIVCGKNATVRGSVQKPRIDFVQRGITIKTIQINMLGDIQEGVKGGHRRT